MRHLAVAFGFLTRLPVPDVSGDGATPVTDDDLRLATAWFPLVGLVLGCLAGLVRWATAGLTGPLTASVLAVAAGAMLTGAFHEDGWADTFDGLWGGWTPERRIEIMRDSRVGTYGGLALVLGTLLQVSALAGIADARTAGTVVAGAHLLGRLSILVQIRTGRPATDQGSGAKVAAPLSLPVFVVVAAASLTAFVAIAIGAAGPIGAAVALGAMLLVVWVLGAIARHKIGGATGDVLGATAYGVLLSTMVVLAAAVA